MTTLIRNPRVSSVPPDLRPKPKAKPPVRPRPQAPVPPTDQQLAEQQLAPVVQRITDAINQRSRMAADAVRGYTGNLAQQLAGVDYAAPYRAAIPQQAAVDEALRSSLAGRGSELAQGLRDRLASLQAPGAVEPAAGAVQGFGEAAGNTELARGSSALSALLANQAAAGGYGAKQPGIARLAGLQGLGRVEGQAVNDIAEQTAPLYGKLPDIVSSIQTNRARQQQLDLENALARKKYGIDVLKTKATIAQGNQRLTISQQNANTAAARAANAEKWAEKNYGISLQKLRDDEAKAATARKSGGLTPTKLADLRKQAAAELQTYYHGVAAKYQIGPDGQRVLVAGTGPDSVKTYQDAIQALTLAYPALGPKQIIAMANKLYKPGEGGRPQYTAAERKRMKEINASLFPSPFESALTGG